MIYEDEYVGKRACEWIRRWPNEAAREKAETPELSAMPIALSEITRSNPGKFGNQPTLEIRNETNILLVAM